MVIQRIVRVVSALGAVLLFGAWLLQATLVDRANESLRSVDAAQGVYQTYQSNNALFNAVLASIADANASDYNAYPPRGARPYARQNYETIRRLQVTNYELGLESMESALEESMRDPIPDADVSASAQEAIERTQTRLAAIQTALAEREESLVRHKDRVYQLFFGIYLIGSLAILGATVVGSTRE